MRPKRLLYFALGIVVVVGMGALSFDDSSITFADGTTQTTAATPATDSWPMICKTDLDIPLLTWATSNTLFCRSPQPEVPGGTIGSGAGVPDGHYFVVTDVTAHCGSFFDDGCEGAYFALRRVNIGSPFVVEEWFYFLSAVNANIATVTVAATGPQVILAPGDYLTAFPYTGAGTDENTDISLQVSGYLSDRPERFRS